MIKVQKYNNQIIYCIQYVHVSMYVRSKIIIIANNKC